MSKKELCHRYILCIISLFISGLGVAVTKHGELGVSPISSVANVLSLRFTFFSMGTWLILWNCVLIIGQILILRRKFQPIQLLQVPLSFLFGWFTDLGMLLADFLPADSYLLRLLWVMLGVIILGFGIALSVTANVIMNAGEAFVKAAADTMQKNFGNVKIAFDISCVLFSILLSLLLCGGTIVGTREGTIIAALCTGMTVKFFTKMVKHPLNAILTDKEM